MIDQKFQKYLWNMYGNTYTKQNWMQVRKESVLIVHQDTSESPRNLDHKRMNDQIGWIAKNTCSYLVSASIFSNSFCISAKAEIHSVNIKKLIILYLHIQACRFQILTDQLTLYQHTDWATTPEISANTVTIVRRKKNPRTNKQHRTYK